jgi:hypothetical protein
MSASSRPKPKAALYGRALAGMISAAGFIGAVWVDPALADDGHRHHWRRPPHVVYAPPPRVAYAAPPVVYAPPPVYAPAPPVVYRPPIGVTLGIGINLP